MLFLPALFEFSLSWWIGLIGIKALLSRIPFRHDIIPMSAMTETRRFAVSTSLNYTYMSRNRDGPIICGERSGP